MSTKIALITGITGQDGAYLSKLLLEKGYAVHGTLHGGDPERTWRLSDIGVQDRVTLHPLNLLSGKDVASLVSELQPAEIYNLAAQSSVAASWREPLLTADVNALAPLRLLEAIRTHSPQSRFYQAGSSELFGDTATHDIQDESTPLRPRSPYAISKLFAHWTVINYRKTYDLFACSGILFSHESPLRGLEFVTRKITDGVSRIKLGLATEITLGSLDIQRDWGFAGDYVEAMWRILQCDTPEEFVIASGVLHSLRDFLSLAFLEVGIKDWQPYVRFDDRYLRPAELAPLTGNSVKAARLLHWKATTDFPALVSMMVQSDLKRLSTTLA